MNEDDLLKKCTIIWYNVGAKIKKEFDSELFRNIKFLTTKIKYHVDEASDFHNKEMPKANSNHTCLAAIIIDSALKKDQKCSEKKVNTLRRKKRLDILLRT